MMMIMMPMMMMMKIRNKIKYCLPGFYYYYYYYYHYYSPPIIVVIVIRPTVVIVVVVVARLGHVPVNDNLLRSGSGAASIARAKVAWWRQIGWARWTIAWHRWRRRHERRRLHHGRIVIGALCRFFIICTTNKGMYETNIFNVQKLQI